MQAEKSPTETKAPGEATNGSGSDGNWGERAVSPAPKRKPPVALMAILGVGLLAGGAFGIRWWLHQLAYVSTDDALIAGNLVTVSPRVPGTIAELLVDEGSI
ncbi:MAG: hypothetical protein KGR26_03250, partial [Cyanobacteria bacterium REEB65]|nr:hypothetical protein [Cyanobacteria bacterium REEB65]